MKVLSNELESPLNIHRYILPPSLPCAAWPPTELWLLYLTAMALYTNTLCLSPVRHAIRQAVRNFLAMLCLLLREQAGSAQ